MNDLPQAPTITPKQTPVSGGLNKEAEKIPAALSEVPSAQLESANLSPEVQKAGVSIRPTSFPVPASLEKIGVAPAGENVSVVPPALSVPLTDEKIAQGLQQNITSAWLWLATWCQRRLLVIRRGLRPGKV